MGIFIKLSAIVLSFRFLRFLTNNTVTLPNCLLGQRCRDGDYSTESFFPFNMIFKIFLGVRAFSTTTGRNGDYPPRPQVSKSKLNFLKEVEEICPLKILLCLQLNSKPKQSCSCIPIYYFFVHINHSTKYGYLYVPNKPFL